ncbi:N-6 DNA methylase [Parasutterella sp.]|uniref:class I SAM-dependent DNA methyltransferase n=1 Tax=Parasutterella sp. TaxID=2049037 RepID=UPI0035208043
MAKAKKQKTSNQDQISNLSKKVWNMADVLAGAGIGYTDYLTQLTYLLFLKMDQENDDLMGSDSSSPLPADCKWASLTQSIGDDLVANYENILATLKDSENELVRTIFAKAQNKISQPASLQQIISMIDEENWLFLEDDVKGALYESLLEKNGKDTKSGAGQYFTPRALISAIVDVVEPKIGEIVRDPACGTGGFLLAAFQKMKEGVYDADKIRQLKETGIGGNDNTALVVTMAAMNTYLHGLNQTKCVVHEKDSLLSPGEPCDVILANPPFGDRKAGSVGITRDDFWVSTKNNQLNFLQHMMLMLKPGGRAGIVLPDSVLFDSQGKEIRKKLLEEFNLHTILRMPSGIFYAGIQSNVLFFTKGESTKSIWYYDYRKNVKHTKVENPLKRSDLDEFVACAQKTLNERVETFDAEENPAGRWKKIDVADIKKDDNLSLDIPSWIPDKKNELEDLSIAELLELAETEAKKISASIASMKKQLQSI